jgi:hypothetical protein
VAEQNVYSGAAKRSRCDIDTLPNVVDATSTAIDGGRCAIECQWNVGSVTSTPFRMPLGDSIMMLLPGNSDTPLAIASGTDGS